MATWMDDRDVREEDTKRVSGIGAATFRARTIVNGLFWERTTVQDGWE